jgi:Fumarase
MANGVSGTQNKYECKMKLIAKQKLIQMMGWEKWVQKKPIHPNDHVNKSQSTNDVISYSNAYFNCNKN